MSKPTKNLRFAEVMCESAVMDGCASVALVEHKINEKGERELSCVKEYI